MASSERPDRLLELYKSGKKYEPNFFFNLSQAANWLVAIFGVMALAYSYGEKTN